MKKKMTICAIFLVVSGCSQAPAECHRWTTAEIKQLQASDRALPSNDIMHALVKNYEELCAI